MNILLSNVEGIRLQPLVELRSGKYRGYEVLTHLTSATEPELFFCNLSVEASLFLFFRQLDTVRKLDEPVLFFLNLPVRVLADPECLKRLQRVRICYRRNVVIELQDPETLLGAGSSQINVIKKHIRHLRNKGWSIWLDDLTSGVWCGMKDDGFWFDGVKTDRREIGGGILPLLVSRARQLGNRILIEGIETEEDLLRASDSGAEWGQGFLWPERTIAILM